MSVFYDIFQKEKVRMEILDGLTSLDLSSRQAKVYLALLQRGSASAIELAKSTGFKHPTVYDVLDSLKERNLISECYTGSKRRFTAENPEVFKEQEARRMSSLEAILPSLLDLYQSGPRRPVIRVYQGRDEIRKADEELLNVKSKEYFYFGSMQEVFNPNDEKYLRDYYRRRIERGIWSNSIRNKPSEATADYSRPGDHNLRRVRYLPQQISEKVAELFLYDDKIAVHSTMMENYAVIIESRELFILLKTIWDCLWAVSLEPEEAEKKAASGRKTQQS